MLRLSILLLNIFVIGSIFFPQSAYAERQNIRFGGTLLDECTIDSNPGGQLGFLTHLGTPYGVTSLLNGGNEATLQISCNRANRQLAITSVEMTSPTPNSFTPTARWAEAIRQGSGNLNTKTTTYTQTGISGSTIGAIRLSGNQTDIITVNMRAEQSPTVPLEAGTYRFNVRLTVVP